MIILGIDPGTATTGYGIIKKTRALECVCYGLIQTDASSTPAQRLKKLNNELAKLIKKYQPEVLAIENLYFFKNLKTAMPVSQAKGVILLTAAKKNLPIHEFTPPQVKMAVSGYGNAEKKTGSKNGKSYFGAEKRTQAR